MNDQSQPRAPASVARVEQWIAFAVIAVLLAGCYLVLQPFLTAIIWAIVLCCTTWPTFRHVQHWLRGHVIVSALLVTLAVAVVLLAPFIIVGISLAENANQMLEVRDRKSVV